MMKKMMASVVLFVCASAAQGLAQAVPDAELEKACVALQKVPSDMQAVQVLQRVAKDKAYPGEWRSRALGVCALTSLIQLNSNQFCRVAVMLEEEFPEKQDLKEMLTESLSQCMRVCVRCQGTGEQEVSCPTCLASGNCKTCDGTGKRNATLCPTCKGSKLCARCAGAKTMAITCPECKGSKGTFAPNNLVLGNCQFLLKGLLDDVRASLQKAQSLHQLEGEKFIFNALAELKRLDAYLAENPHVAAQGEFVALRNKLSNHKLITLGAFALGGCVLLLVLVAILKATVFRPKPAPLRRPPGLEAIDHNKFTDPLTLDKPGGKK